ncbi:MAG: hypothetical protein KC503_36550, partial [Myxococcales bacterium]|nr:hypothetical protein [Myxococcales bacterium]
PAAPTRVPTRVSVTVAKNAARRGQRLRVWGKVENFDGLGVANLRVEIYLSRDGRAAQALLGAAITDKGGGYDVELPIPRNIVVGRYKVFAATPGDQRHEASLSE